MMYTNEYYIAPKRQKSLPQLLIWCVGLCSVVFLLFSLGRIMLTQAYLPPADFPVNETLRIEEGMTAEEAALYLKKVDALKSAHIFTLTFKSEYSDKFIQAGSYTFPNPLTVEELIQALTTGSFSSPDSKVTFPEGFRITDIPQYLEESMTVTSGQLIGLPEGYLFPDTYHLEADTTFDELITSMEENYEAKIAPLRDKIAASGFTESEVIILASIIEREANDPTSMRLVSGVLQNRLRENMPLQVDAVFEYLLGKTSAELTLEDLEMDSPYNTYTNTGLPPTPISNPGLTSILAVLEPAPTKFMYYLTGDDGKFYYAETFEEHKVNKARHLR